MKLLFVYNADSGAVNLALDIAHKLISPSTYQCDLCNLTHGVFKETAAWKRFRESSPHELVFLHRDEFEKQYQERFDYPVVLELADVKFHPVVACEEIRQMPDIDALIACLQSL